MRKRVLFLSISAPLLLLIFGLIWWFRSGSLAIEAKIIYNVGGPQPVARQTFYLLDADPFSLTVDDPKYKAKIQQSSDDEKTVIEMAGLILALLQKSVSDKSDAEKAGKTLLPFLEQSKPFWEAHIVQSAQTDFNGHAEFESIRPGDYWLIGMTETRASFAFWNLKVSIGRGRNDILLDQGNASYSK